MERFFQDASFAGRGLRRSPGFTAAVVLTLGLGIGAFTAIFTLVDAVLLRPLPYPDAGRLVWLGHDAPGINFRGLALSPGLFGVYAARSESLDGIGHWSESDATLSGAGDAVRVRVIAASSGFFRLLGVRPLHGRLLNTEDDEVASSRVALLSHSLWRSRYGSDAAIVGKTIRVDGTSHEIVGILPPGFAFARPDTAVWLDSEVRIPVGDFGDFGGFSAIGRRRPGIGLDDVRRDLDARIAELLASIDNPTRHRMFADARIAAQPIDLQQRIVGSISRTLWVLFGTVGLVLGIACVNVAHLFLVRATGRGRETAVRAALGASRAQLARFLFAESATLALLGGAVGLLIAFAGARLLPAAAPFPIPRVDEIAIDARVIGCAALISLAVAAIFGVIPLARREERILAGLDDGAIGATPGRRRFAVRKSLLVSQVAMALVLLVGSGLMMRSFANLRAVDPRFDASRVLRFSLALPVAEYPQAATAADFHHRLLAALSALPGVVAAGAGRSLPLEGSGGGVMLYEEGSTLEDGSLPPLVSRNRVTAGYFDVFEIAPVVGRLPAPVDGRPDATGVAVNRALAELYWPGENPVGKRIRTDRMVGTEEPAWLTVVGVVDNHRFRLSPDDADAAMLFMPMLGGDSDEAHTISYALRTSVPPLTLAAAVRDAVRDADANLPVLEMLTMQQVADAQVAPLTFTMTLLVIGSVVSLLLGALGVYGVFSFVVGERGREIGVRMALGASAVEIRRLLLAQSLAIGTLGAGLGLVGSWALGRALDAWLVGVGPFDPATHLSVFLLLIGVVMLAASIPARRAASADPAAALRR